MEIWCLDLHNATFLFLFTNGVPNQKKLEDNHNVDLSNITSFFMFLISLLANKGL